MLFFKVTESVCGGGGGTLPHRDVFLLERRLDLPLTRPFTKPPKFKAARCFLHFTGSPCKCHMLHVHILALGMLRCVLFVPTFTGSSSSSVKTGFHSVQQLTFPVSLAGRHIYLSHFSQFSTKTFRSKDAELHNT